MRGRLLVIGISVAAVATAAGWWYATTWVEDAVQQKAPYVFTTDEVALLQDGDIILRRGSGMVSDMIASMLNEDHDLSHCGIIVERGGKYAVVHAVSNNISDHDGMQVHGLQEFVRQSKRGSVVVCRLRTSQSRAPISRQAVAYLKRKVPFDHHFDRNDTSSLYCSELPWRIIRDEYGIDLLEGTSDDQLSAFRFARFMDPRWFDLVLDHQKK